MSFTPLVVSVDGMLAPEIANFLRRIGEALSTKWEKPYSKTMNWVKCGCLLPCSVLPVFASEAQGPSGGVLAQTMISYPREKFMDVLQ